MSESRSSSAGSGRRGIGAALRDDLMGRKGRGDSIDGKDDGDGSEEETIDPFQSLPTNFGNSKRRDAVCAKERGS